MEGLMGEVAYYVPGDVIFGLASNEPPERWSKEQLYENQEQFLRDLSKAGLDVRGSFNAVFEQTVLPAPDDAKQSLVLLRLQQADRAGLSRYLTRVFSLTQKEFPGLSNGARLTFVTPNWFGGHSQTHIGTGGPAGKPQAVTNTDPSRCEFDIQALNDILAAHAGTHVPDSVDVYVLDTMSGVCRRAKGDHPLSTLTGTFETHIDDPSGFIKHPLGKVLNDLHRNALTDPDWWTSGNELALTCAEDLCPGIFNELYDSAGNSLYYVEDQDGGNRHAPYDVSDHGIFIAGIIKEIAPDARLHVIEVLNQYGVGTLFSVCVGLAHVQKQRRLAGLDTPYVLNCSFTFDIPVIANRKTRTRFNTLHDMAKSDPLYRFVHATPFPDALEKFLDTLFSSPQPIQVDKTNGLVDTCLVVAAAGNDSNLRLRKAARYPANLAAVLGVGALAPDFNVEPYSNFSDMPLSDGIATVGKIQSIFTQHFPAPASANPTGFAVWSGTSFAAPAIAGCVAQICLKTDLSPRAALNALHGRATLGAAATVTEVRFEIEQPAAALTSP